MSNTVALKTIIERVADHIYRSTDDTVLASDDATAWIELHGLDSHEAPRHVLARQAAFNVLLKTTLYKHYRESTSADLPPLDSSDIRMHLREAKSRTGDVAFEEFLLDEIAWHAPTTALFDLIEARTYLLDTDQPAEVIGRIFEEITPQESRRTLGQFRTPPKIADLMATWAIQEGDSKTFDPGIGAGSLSVAAYERKCELTSDASLADVRGVDLNELALVMSATALRLSDHGGPHGVHVGDFLDLEPEILDDTVDVVICNPPYSRHHALDDKTKTRVNEQAEAISGTNISSLSSLYTYFYIHATEFLGDDGRMSFITPAEFLETNYGEDIKQFLLDTFDIRALVMANRDASVFEEAMTTTCISFLERRSETETTGETKFVKVDDWPSNEEVLRAIEDDTVAGETEWGFVNSVPQADIEANDKWTVFFDSFSIADVPRLKPFDEIGGVNRGIATGANDYFCLSQSEVDEWGIEEEYLSPLIRGTDRAKHYTYTEADWERQRRADDEVWLLYHLDVWRPNLDGTNVKDYLEHGMEVGADESYLARNRNPWYLVDRREPSDVLFTYMSRGTGRFTYNAANVRNLNNLHAMYLDEGYSESEIKALLAYLNSDFGDTIVKRSGRTYMGGLSKVEPSELENVPVLDPKELDTEDVEALSTLFDKLCRASRDGQNIEIEGIHERITGHLRRLLDIPEIDLSSE